MRGKSVSCLGQYTAERLLLAMNTSLRFAVLTGFRLGTTPRIIYQELVQAHGEAICPAERTVERWVCEMKKGTFPLVKNKPPGRPRAVRTTDLVQDVSKMLQDNPRSSLREVALQLGTDHMTIFRIVTWILRVYAQCGCQLYFQKLIRRTVLSVLKPFSRMFRYQYSINTVSRTSYG